jgi:hypothetical protein
MPTPALRGLSVVGGRPSTSESSGRHQGRLARGVPLEAALLVQRFLTTGGPTVLKMMNMSSHNLKRMGHHGGDRGQAGREEPPTAD